MGEGESRQLIEECRPPGADPVAERPAAALENRPAAGPVALVTGFAGQLSTMPYRLDHREPGEEPSGDGFLHTRAAGVAAGRAEYLAVPADSGRFAPYAAEYVRAEPLLYVPDQAYRRLTGEEWNRGTAHSYESYSDTEGRAQPRPTGVQAGPDGGASGGV
ncbi:hypothetical protein ACI1MP_28365 [Kitasatospora griseola]|uniref:hypothetical protein n=1 Tax=Kitasatospora griseola TaxID=2064 RepID=UPI00385590FC